MRIFIYKNQCVNVDNDADAVRLLQQGARELTTEEIRKYGMAGYEQYVSPMNTIINADGTVTFTPPAPPSDEELFSKLREERDRRLAECDWTMLKDTQLSEEQSVAWQTYRQILRDMPQQAEAPWDGGGEGTPWPMKP